MTHHNQYVAPQIVDAIVAINESVVGLSPAMAAGTQQQAMAYNLALAGMNAVAAQNNSYPTNQAAMVAGVIQMFKQ